jgi:hypothetical protein
MTATELELFDARLTSALTEADRKEEKRELRRPGGRVNIFRIAHYLVAAAGVVEAVKGGSTPEAAFAKGFNPTRDMHAVAKKLGLALDVERGRWVPLAKPATA